MASASQLRLGGLISLYIAWMKRSFLKKAIAGCHAAPLSPNLSAALGYLRQLYNESGHIDEEVDVARNEVEFHEKAGSSDAPALLRRNCF